MKPLAAVILITFILFSLEKLEAQKADDFKINSNMVLLEDPYIVWGSFLGCTGSGWTNGYKVVRSATNNIYFVGDSKGNCLGTSGSHQQSLKGYSDGFIQKFNESGERIWGTYFGGSNSELIIDIVEDQDQNIVVLGETNSIDYISTPNAYMEEFQGGQSDSFIAKFNAEGELVWCTYFGGEGKEEPSTIEIDNDNNIWVGGATQSHSNMSTPNSHQPEFYNWTDAYFAKFTPEGELLFCSYYGGEGWDEISDIHCDSENNIYICGETESYVNISTPNSHQADYYPSYYCAFLAKFDAIGNRIWGTYLGGPGGEEIMSVCTDDNNNTYCVGYTCSSINIATPNSYQEAQEGYWSGFINKFNPDGERIWGTYYGGESSDHLKDVKNVSEHSMIIAVGNTNSTTGIATPNAHQPDWYPDWIGNDPLNDGMIIGFNYEGERLWGTYLGGDRWDILDGLDADSSHIYYIGTSTTQSSEYLTTPGCFQEQGYSGYQAIIGRFSLVDTITSINQLNPQSEIKLFPNPCLGNYAFIESTEALQSITVFNSFFSIVEQIELSGIRRYSLNHTAYSSGLYFIEIRSSHKRWILKLLKNDGYNDKK